jgi:CheY-like chemotaxis protein
MLTLLVADDEFAVLEVLSLALEGEGYRVLKAGDGADALRILSSHRCDVVICDENMPAMNGHQLIAAIRAEPRHVGTPIIMMVDLQVRALPLLEDIAVLPKPVQLSELFTTVDQAAKSRRAP